MLILLACTSCTSSATSAPTCTPLASFQCTPPTCYPTWADVQASAGANCDVDRETWGACDRYFFRSGSEVDLRFTAYYDKASGALAAFSSNTNGLASCVAGPDGVPSASTCPTDGATTDPCASDAGRGN